MHTHPNLYDAGFPHVVSEEDIHDGYYIPKGTIVIPNAWYGILVKHTASLTSHRSAGSCYTILGYIPVLWSSAHNDFLLAREKNQRLIL